MNNGENKLRAAMYLRLSRDDDDYKDESQSISNQRDFITDYIRKRDDIIIIGEYVDDGYSGSNFDRPDFQRLIEDIKHKKINCVIVKDQSRFGRNDLVPYYLKQYFPMNKVVFIAPNSYIDTSNENAVGNKMIGINSFVDAKYCEDISDKVKATIYTKKKMGQHLGGQVLYGYKKDPKDKYRIVVDEKVAPVVRRIFDMFVKGNSLNMICKTLDKENIPIPSVYKNLNRGNKSLAYGHWQTRTIDEMLKNEMYIGNMCQCRTKRPVVSIKTTIRNPKDKWIIVENTHEPIIDKGTFNLVQSIYAKNSHMTKKTNKFLLKGFVICKECGHTIGINVTRGKGYCVCNFYRKYSKYNYCTPHSIPYDLLEKRVLKEVKRVMRMANKLLLTDTLKKSDRTLTKIKQLERENHKLEEDIANSQTREDEAYMDKIAHKITFETYNDVRNMLIAEKENNRNKLLENKEKIKLLKGNAINSDYEKIVNEYISLKKPNRQLLSSIIDNIVLDKDLNIEINYKIRTPF